MSVSKVGQSPQKCISFNIVNNSNLFKEKITFSKLIRTCDNNDVEQTLSSYAIRHFVWRLTSTYHIKKPFFNWGKHGSNFL